MPMRQGRDVDSSSYMWFALGVVLTTATQLRIGSTPIGIGEILLVLWVILVGFPRLSNGRLHSGLATVMGGSWWGMLACLLTGWMVSNFIGLHSATSLHSLLAFMFLGVIVVFVFVEGEIGIQRVLRLVGILTVACYSVLMLWGQYSSNLGPVALWYGPRFSGWAINPNQLALALAGLPFVSLYFGGREKRRTVWYATTLVAVVVGVATDSDALSVAWAVGFLVALTSWWILQGQSRISARVLRFILLLIVAVGVILVLWRVVFPLVVVLVQHIYESGNQGAVRLTLWQNGIVAWMRSPVFGLGPGAFSGAAGPFEGKESHNTFVDWGTSTGIVGMIVYLSTLTWLWWQTREKPLLSGAFVALVAFSVFHFVIRQPVFWVYILGLAALARSGKSDQS